MMYRYFLDNVLIPEPEGWDKFVTSIKRDKSNNGITVAKDFTLTFGKTVYDIFQNTINTTGYCAEINLLIEYSLDNGNNWQTFHIGVIYISDVEFDEKRKECTAKVQDNSYYAYINNNVNVGAFLFAGKSKNGVVIPTPPLQYLQCFDITNNVPFPINTTNGFEYKSYLVYDVFKYLISFMTDNKVDFMSTTFDVGGIYHDYVITTGYVLRYSVLNGYNGAVNPAGINQTQFQDSWQQLTFKDFYDEMYKRFNLTWWIETVAGVPTFRIETESDSRVTSANNLSTNYIDELKSQIDSDLLFSNLKISGGANEAQTPFLFFPDRINLLGFREEDLLVSGQCNLDNTLSLETKYIQDTNIIQDCTENGWATAFTDDYDNEIFVINAVDDLAGTCNAVGTNWLQAAPPIFYNEQLNNYNIVSRFYDGIPNSLAQYLGNGDNTFRAYQFPMGAYTPAIINEPIIFTDITPPNGFDAGGNYNTVLSRYVAPFQGLYTFRVQVGMIATAAIPSAATAVTFGVNVYDSLNILQSTTIFKPTFTTGGLYYDVSVDFNSVYMGVSWYAQIAMLELTGGDSTDPSNYIYFECINAANDGLINYVDEDKIAATKYSFKVPMTFDELKLIESNLPSLFPFERFGDSAKRYGWIKSLRYNHKDNVADVTLITSKQYLYGN